MKNNPETIVCKKIAVEIRVYVCGLDWYSNKGFLKISQTLEMEKFDKKQVVEFINENSGDFSKVIGGYIEIIDLYENHGYLWNSEMYIDIDGKLTDKDKKYLLCCAEDY